MDNPTALKQARALCPANHALNYACYSCRSIAAALKRAYAEGMDYSAECILAASAGRLGKEYRSSIDIRAEADQLEGNKGEVMMTETKEVFSSGASSTKIARFDLIPRHFMIRLATRFELGLERHGERSWNARSSQGALDDKEFLMARCAHIVDHATKFMQKLDRGIETEGDDDAGAIAWAAALLCEATNPERVRSK